MFDAKKLIEQLQNSDPSLQKAAQKFQRALETDAGKQAAQNIDHATADRIAAAAKAAQSGDKSAAKAAISQILSTPQGAELARKLQEMLRK